MCRAASLTALLVLAGVARAADFEPLQITAAPWIQSVGSIQAAPGTTPSRLTGVLTQGSFVTYVDASVDKTGDAVVLHLSGTATSFNANQNTIDMALGASGITFVVPQSAQSTVQVFADWLITSSAGWEVYATSTPGEVFVDALQGVALNAYLGAQNHKPPAPNEVPYIGMAELPAGETARLVSQFPFLRVTSTTNTPGPFNVTATLRFRYAKPLALGDVNANGVPDLADVAILRRQLAGEPVNLP